jgi:predicted lipoprotein with Yx(FWY)xxD motif
MPRTTSSAFLAGAAVLLTALALAGCGSNGSNGNASAAPPTTANGGSATIGVANGDLGKILVDSQGRTLYLFSKDSGTKSSCTGECANDWPPLRANGKPTEGSGANPSLVGTTARPDGKPQVTYNGHPVYLFEMDKKPGDTNGEGLNAFGGSWYALSPAGNQVSGPPAKSGGGGGYGY